MSCVVGMVRDGTVYMGCDSIYVDGWVTDHTVSSKLFRKEEFLIGSTGSIRVRQLMAHAFAPPPIPDDCTDLEGYMVTVFVDALRACLKAAGREQKENGVEHGGTFLVAVRGQLFKIGSSYQAVQMRSGYAAIGCADATALGALAAAELLDCPPTVCITTALQIAAKHNMGVAGPFHFETLVPESQRTRIVVEFSEPHE